MSARGTFNISIPNNMSPPHDLTSYSRSMHSHTKRQMEAANMPVSRRSGQSRNGPMASMPNGTSTDSTASATSAMNGVHGYHPSNVR
ncbi:hypothetical protein F5Y14DRAFT_403967 [Nemania sp. NC0429]|nr:hypothetical protein F5Y14DRAFT_403967 [Nemania sp. NC0429]